MLRKGGVTEVVWFQWSFKEGRNIEKMAKGSAGKESHYSCDIVSRRG